MKNKILGSGSILAIAVLTILNVQFTELESDANQLQLSQLLNEAHAQAEWGGWSNFFQGQGFWKDEREQTFQCSGSSGGTVRVCVAYRSGGCIEWEYQSAGPTTKVDCLNGSDNCSSTSC